MKAILDGVASFAAALATVVICGFPSWFTFKAIAVGAAPIWAWVSIALLGAIGVLLTVAFLEKAVKGISPSRNRRRR